MAKYIVQSESLTAIADEIRELSGTTTSMSLDVMKANLNEANEDVSTQAELIAQIATALEGKAAGNNEGNTSVEDSLVDRSCSVYTNNRITTIGKYVFQGCSNLTTVSFPVVTSIGQEAFYGCSNLTAISFPAATTIGDSAFNRCSNLTVVSFPAATSIGDFAFYGCSNLTTVSFPVVTSIGQYAFDRCSNLTTINFPATTSIDSYAFNDCSNLTDVSFPVVTTIDTYAFQGCPNLTNVSFPVVTSINNNAFQSCSSLTTVSFPSVTSIGNFVFRHCYNLKSLYLMGSSLCTLISSAAFTSTPIGGYSTSAGTYGSIYVPSSLLTSYQTATNWTYFSSRFVGI